MSVASTARKNVSTVTNVNPNAININPNAINTNPNMINTTTTVHATATGLNVRKVIRTSRD